MPRKWLPKARASSPRESAQLAIEHGIPILERKPLARALYKMCNVGQEVPEQYFSAIAEILAYVYELNGKFKQKHFARASRLE